MRYLRALVAWIAIWKFYFLERASNREKCPACGSISWHKITFSVMHGKLLHECPCCKAVWGLPPLRNFEQWQVEGPALPEDPLENAREPNRGIKVVASGHKAATIETDVVPTQHGVGLER